MTLTYKTNKFTQILKKFKISTPKSLITNKVSLDKYLDIYDNMKDSKSIIQNAENRSVTPFTFFEFFLYYIFNFQRLFFEFRNNRTISSKNFNYIFWGN